MVSRETLSGSSGTDFYTPEYVTSHGIKEIDFYGTPTRVHNTPHLPDLLTCFFNAQAGIGPRNEREAALFARLANPEVTELISNALKLNPSFSNMLQTLSMVREQEAQAGMVKPEEEFKRDYIYSSALQHLGDAATHSGRLHLLEQIA